jgi:hypothetical protein
VNNAENFFENLPSLFSIRNESTAALCGKDCHSTLRFQAMLDA